MDLPPDYQKITFLDAKPQQFVALILKSNAEKIQILITNTSNLN